MIAPTAASRFPRRSRQFTRGTGSPDLRHGQQTTTPSQRATSSSSTAFSEAARRPHRDSGARRWPRVRAPLSSPVRRQSPRLGRDRAAGSRPLSLLRPRRRRSRPLGRPVERRPLRGVGSLAAAHRRAGALGPLRRARCGTGSRARRRFARSRSAWTRRMHGSSRSASPRSASWRARSPTTRRARSANRAKGDLTSGKVQVLSSSTSSTRA